jgi:hypothetical protein
MATQTIIGGKIIIDTSGVKISFAELQKLYKEQLKALKEISDVGSDEYKEQAKVVSALKGEISAMNSDLSEQAREYKKIKETEPYKKLVNETRDLKNESKNLAAQLLELEKAGKKNTKEFKELEKQYDEVTEKAQKFDKELKEIDANVGDNFRKVGDYTGGIIDAFEQVGGAAGSTINVFQQVNQTMKVVAANPLLFVLGAIIAILGKLGQAFGKSEKGASIFRKATAILNGIMSTLVSISVEIFNWFEKIFSGQSENIKKFGDFLETQILTRIYGLVDGVIGLGKVMKAVFSGDFKAAADEAKKASEGFKNIFTGDVNEDGIKKNVDALTESVKKNAAEFIALDNAKRAAEKSSRALALQLEDLITKEELLRQQSEDESKGLLERVELQKQLLKASEDRAKVEVAIAKNSLGVLNQELAIRRSNGEEVTDLLGQQTDAMTAVKAAERELTLLVGENEQQRYLLRRDSFERSLDVLIDGVDSYKSANERLLLNEELTLDERAKILENTKKQFDKSFKDQIKLVEDFTGKVIDGNDLIMESDDELLAQKIENLEVDDIISGRIMMDIVKDRRAGILDLQEAERDLNEKRKEFRQNEIDNEIEVANQLNKIQFEKRLISQSEYNIKSIEIEISRLEKELEINNLKGNELIAATNEIELQKIALKQANLQKETDLINEKFANEKILINEQFLNGIIDEETHNAKILELQDAYEIAKLEKLIENGDNTAETLQILRDAEVQMVKDKNKEIEEEEQKSRDKRVAIANEIVSLSSSIISDFSQFQLNQAAGDEAKMRKIQKRQFAINKAVSITEAGINSFTAFNKALATYAGTPLAFVIPPLHLAAGLANVVKIASAEPNFYTGGYTGDGGKYQDAGRVHKGEVVFNQQDVQMLGGWKNVEALRPTSKTPIASSANDNTIAMIEATNNRIDMITVIADSEGILDAAMNKKIMKQSRTQ